MFFTSQCSEITQALCVDALSGRSCTRSSNIFNAPHSANVPTASPTYVIFDIDTILFHVGLRPLRAMISLFFPVSPLALVRCACRPACCALISHSSSVFIVFTDLNRAGVDSTWHMHRSTQNTRSASFQAAFCISVNNFFFLVNGTIMVSTNLGHLR